MKTIKSLFIAASLMILSIPTLAEDLSPYEVASTVGNNLFSRIIEQKNNIKLNPHVMEEIVAQELMPHVDHRYAAFKILGKNLKKTSKDQREKFANTMKDYLIQTYAKALTQYNNQAVTFEPESNYKGKRIVPVKAVINNKNKDIVIVFKMRKHAKSKQWKAFDMVVEGISLLSSKQAEIGSRIRANGIDKVTVDLATLTAS